MADPDVFRFAYTSMTARLPVEVTVEAHFEIERTLMLIEFNEKERANQYIQQALEIDAT